jgi:hypothetical protein
MSILKIFKHIPLQFLFCFAHILTFCSTNFTCSGLYHSLVNINCTLFCIKQRIRINGVCIIELLLLYDNKRYNAGVHLKEVNLLV